MNAIEWLTPEENGVWDAFVAQHPLGLIYHLSAWQEVLETAFKHIRGRILVLREPRGQIRAGLPVYNITSWLLKNRTVSVPFATLCDPLVSSKEDLNLLWRGIENAAVKNRSKRVEIRTRRLGAANIPEFLAPNARYKHHYLPLDKDTKTLLNSFHPSCVSRRIKKARREGLLVEERHDAESLRVFHSIMASTRRRLLLPPMPYAFFEAMFDVLRPDRASLYLTIHEGQPIAGMLALKFNGMWTSEYSGHIENAHSCADQCLYWSVIERAKESGAQFFSFGRTSLDNTGLLEYKQRWATIEEDLVDYVRYLDGTPVPAEEEESTHSVNPVLYSAARLIRYAPVSIQQKFGDFCYRHLG